MLNWRYFEEGVLWDWPDDARKAFVKYLKKYDGLFASATRGPGKTVVLGLFFETKIGQLWAFVEEFTLKNPCIPPIRLKVVLDEFGLGPHVAIWLNEDKLEKWRLAMQMGKFDCGGDVHV